MPKVTVKLERDGVERRIQKPRRPNVDADNYVFYHIDGKPSSKVCIRWPIFESEGDEIPATVTLEW